MKKFLVAALLTIFSLCNIPIASATHEFGCYVAIISSPDLVWYFDKHPQLTKDFQAVIGDWGYLDGVLQDIKTKSNGQKLVMDFMVHGADDGLYLCSGSGIARVADRASFGYVLNRVQKYFPEHNFILCFESCYPAAAYKNTIRGAKRDSILDKIEDFKGVPTFPVFGVGDGYSNVGPTMYIQLRYRFRKWFVDLRDWDKLGKNKALVEVQPEYFGGLNSMEENILYVTEFFLDHIP